MKLISIDIVHLDYPISSRRDFYLAGFIKINNTSDNYNKLNSISSNAKIDKNKVSVVPVLFNENKCSWLSDCEYDKACPIYSNTQERIKANKEKEIIYSKDINEKCPWIAIFEGNDDISYGLRFQTKQERLDYINYWGDHIGRINYKNLLFIN